MFCCKCGANLGEQAQAAFCTRCGTPAYSGKPVVPPNLPQAKTQSRFWLYALAAIGLLFFMGMCGSYKHDDTTTAAPVKRDASSVQHTKLGDGVVVGYWAYRCLGTQWQRSIGSEYTRQYPDAEFLVIDLAIRNNDTTASTLVPVKLVDPI